MTWIEVAAMAVMFGFFLGVVLITELPSIIRTWRKARDE